MYHRDRSLASWLGNEEIERTDSTMKNLHIAPLAAGEKLSLTNDGRLEVFFLGVGSAFALKNFQTNLLIVKGDQHVVVDFGMTAPRALKELAGLHVTDLNTFLITHSHADHIGGLECAGLMNRFVGQPFMKKEKLRMIITEAYQQTLWDRSLRGGMEWNEENIEAQRPLAFADFFDPIRPTWKKQQPREVYEINVGGIKIEMFRTKHIPDTAPDWQASFPSVGLYLDDRIFISMDTRFDPELIEEYAHRSEVMFHDVQFFPTGVHAPLADLKGLPSDVKAKMFLMHYSDDWEKQDINDFAGWTTQGVRYIF